MAGVFRKRRNLGTETETHRRKTMWRPIGRRSSGDWNKPPRSHGTLKNAGTCHKLENGKESPRQRKCGPKDTLTLEF